MKMVKLNGLDVVRSSIEIDGIEPRDYPDFCDAFIFYAEFANGVELTSYELEQLEKQNPMLVNELAHESCF